MIFHKFLLDEMDDFLGDLVGTVIVVAEARKIIVVDSEIDDDSLFCYGLDFGVFDGRERVDDVGEAGDAEAHGAENICVIKRHLEAFIKIAVTRIMDNVESGDVFLDDEFEHGDEMFFIDDVIIERAGEIRSF